jgi:hypothetical protein
MRSVGLSVAALAMLVLSADAGAAPEIAIRMLNRSVEHAMAFAPAFANTAPGAEPISSGLLKQLDVICTGAR